MAAKELDDKEQYSELIKFLVPINELSPQLQNEVINIGKVLKFKKKDLVFKQGDQDRYTYYILDGQIELLADKQVKSTITSGADSARYAMARLQPRQFSAKCIGDVVVLQLDRAALDRLMVAEQQQNPDDFSSSGGIEVEVSDIGDEDSGDWMTKMLQSELFCRLPTANIHQLFALLESVNYNAGDQVITQGESGEHFYIIQEGKCEVTRAPSPDAKPIKLAELRSGDSFGEEALLTEATRNATITMKTDGVLMQLSKENFINLIKKPTLEEVSYKEGEKLVNDGAIWLDVRFPNEYEQSRIKNSTNIPLNMLRMQVEKLQKDKKYVIYCDTGGRSSAAAFLLTDRGFNVCFLSNGLSSVPEDKLESKPAETLPGSEAKPEPKPVPKPEAPAEEAEEVEEIEDEVLNTDIRSSVLDVDLERTNMDLQEAIKAAMEEDEDTVIEAKATQEKLQAEKKKLEAEKTVVDETAKKLRQQEAEKLEKLKKEAEKRLADEKKKIEEIYARNTKEMEKLQKLKEQAEAQIRKEREKLEKEAAEAKKKNVEVAELKKQLEESRAALEKEAEKQRQEQSLMEQAIQAKAKAKLDAERRKLAEEFARSNEEMEKAQRAQAVANATRKAAHEEAQKIISEYKKQFEAERVKEQARLQEDRKKLEEESRKIQDMMKEIQKGRQDAEAAREAAEREAKKLREIQQDDSKKKDKESQKEVEDQIKAAEARLKEAQKSLETAQEAEVNIEAAKEVNEQELIRQKVEEERLRQQVASDLAEFVEDQKEQEESLEKVVANVDHIKRIRERAAAAKKEAEKATNNLFADVAAQLGKKE